MRPENRPDLMMTIYLLLFFFEKRMSSFSGEKVDLLAVTMSAAVENTLSLGTEVAGTAR